MLEDLNELKNSYINIFRLDFTLEDNDQIENIIEAFIETIENNFIMGNKSKKLFNHLDKTGTITGHYYKGVE